MVKVQPDPAGNLQRGQLSHVAEGEGSHCADAVVAQIPVNKHSRVSNQAAGGASEPSSMLGWDGGQGGLHTPGRAASGRPAPSEPTTAGSPPGT